MYESGRTWRKPGKTRVEGSQRTEDGEAASSISRPSSRSDVEGVVLALLGIVSRTAWFGDLLSASPFDLYGTTAIALHSPPFSF